MGTIHELSGAFLPTGKLTSAYLAHPRSLQKPLNVSFCIFWENVSKAKAPPGGKTILAPSHQHYELRQHRGSPGANLVSGIKATLSSQNRPHDLLACPLPTSHFRQPQLPRGAAPLTRACPYLLCLCTLLSFLHVHGLRGYSSSAPRSSECPSGY